MRFKKIMCIEKTDWEKTVEFHGHICPGLAKGYRVAQIALHTLKENRAIDEEIVAIVENDTCAVDAIQFLTGCTLGKGNLIFRDYGKMVFTFACRNSGKGIRIVVQSGTGGRDDENLKKLFEKISKGTANEEERLLYRRQKEKRALDILDLPEEELCSIEHIIAQLPEKARIFNSLTCAYCGESVSEARARIHDMKYACIPCAGEYTRGWSK